MPVLKFEKKLAHFAFLRRGIVSAAELTFCTPPSSLPFMVNPLENVTVGARERIKARRKKRSPYPIAPPAAPPAAPGGVNGNEDSVADAAAPAAAPEASESDRIYLDGLDKLSVDQLRTVAIQFKQFLKTQRNIRFSDSQVEPQGPLPLTTFSKSQRRYISKVRRAYGNQRGTLWTVSTRAWVHAQAASQIAFHIQNRMKSESVFSF